MLASKIEDVTKLWPSKKPSDFHCFSYRLLIDVGSVLASKMEPSWRPRRLEIRKSGSKKCKCTPSKSGSEYHLASEHRLRTFWHRFSGGQGSIFKDFWMIFRASWLTLGIFSAALANFAMKIQELAEDKAENPRTCRG